MKKRLLIFLATLAFTPLLALPIGNPAEPSLLTEGVIWGSCCSPLCDCLYFQAGFYGDYVFNRNMQLDKENNHKDIELTEIDTNAAYLALTAWNRLNIFATLGTTDIYFRSTERTFLPSGTRLLIEVQTKTGFSWSVGGQGIIFGCGCLMWGIEGQYFGSSPNITYARRDNGVFNHDINAKVKYREWQVGTAISYRINIIDCTTALVPYIGIKGSRARFDIPEVLINTASPATTPRLGDMETSKWLGYAVGFSLVGNERIVVGVEGRFADEKAVYVNGEIRF